MTIKLLRVHVLATEQFFIQIDNVPGLIRVDETQARAIINQGITFIDTITGQTSGRVKRHKLDANIYNIVDLGQQGGTE